MDFNLLVRRLAASLEPTAKDIMRCWFHLENLGSFVSHGPELLGHRKSSAALHCTLASMVSQFFEEDWVNKPRCWKPFPAL